MHCAPCKCFWLSVRFGREARILLASDDPSQGTIAALRQGGISSEAGRIYESVCAHACVRSTRGDHRFF